MRVHAIMIVRDSECFETAVFRTRENLEQAVRYYCEENDVSPDGAFDEVVKRLADERMVMVLIEEVELQ